MSTEHWTWSINDTSPFLTYLPYAQGGISEGWDPYYDSSGFNRQFGDFGIGPSHHLTSFNGASVEFVFNGTAVTLHGSANCSYDVLLDSSVSTNITPGDNNILFSATSLSPSSHSVKLVARPDENQVLSFDSAEFSTPYAANDIVPIKYNTSNSAVQYNGTWVEMNDSKGQIPSPFMQSNKSSASVSLEFDNAVGIAVNGMANYGHWTYFITLDESTTTHNGSTVWLIPDALLFFQQGLDPNTKHKITLSNIDSNQGWKVDFNAFTVFRTQQGAAAESQNPLLSPSGQTSASSPRFVKISTMYLNSINISAISVTSAASTSQARGRPSDGLIAGVTIAAVAVLSGIIAVLLLLWRRRKRRARNASANLQPDAFDVSAAEPHQPVFDDPHGPPLYPKALPYSPDTLKGRPPPMRAVSDHFHTGHTTSPTVYSTAHSTTDLSSPSFVDPASESTVERLLQMIASRIDRRPPGTHDGEHDDTLPRYPN
ncbi:hypothetical protein HGRIS_013754 [Hohenbuehelia grisea]|uniref:Uncharacterized protein n=1 Tax=Hohenbuehelia grisea TaxID=104357 RepID=A0ABR3IWS1_9AGAR